MMVDLQLQSPDDSTNGQRQHASASKSDKSVHTSSLGQRSRTPSFDNCVESMRWKLDCVDDKSVETCSISIVPEQLRKSKVEAYMPQVVSIGPLHKGTRTDLLYMEEIKLHCMKDLFHRTKEENEEVNLSHCIKAMLDIDELVRASYAADLTKLKRYDLAKIMVLDGCFLLELLISGSPELNDQLKYTVKENPNDNSSHDNQAGENPKYTTSPGAEVIKREKVLSDLMMVENQIPLVVLDVLSGVLFGEVFTQDDGIKLIHKLVLSISGYSTPGSSNNSCSEFKAFNFIELIHSFVDKEKKEIKQMANTAESEIMEEDIEVNKCLEICSSENGEVADRKLKLQRCASRLEAAGVTIKPSESQSAASNRVEMTRFNLKITFNNGKLEIPKLHITKTTEAKWRNFIAWELNRSGLEKLRGKKMNKSTGEDRISCQFICYARFFRSLICCVHDVKLLRNENVIVVHNRVKSGKGKKKKMSNEDLLNLIRNITDEISDAEIDMDSRFGQVIQKLNSYPTVDCSTAICRIIVDRVTEASKIFWHIFRYFITWIWYKCRGAYRVLRRVYIPSGWKLIAVLAAAAGLGLTIAQTVFSALGR